MLQIRLAELEDAESISSLILGLIELFLFDPEAAGDFLETLSPAFIEKSIACGELAYLVACAQGEIVGTVGIKDGIHLYHLFVAENRHGQGLGRRLLERAIVDLVEPESRELTVSASINALAFYRRLGFTATAPEERDTGLAWLPMRLKLGSPERP